MRRQWLYRYRRTWGFSASAVAHVALLTALVWNEVPFVDGVAATPPLESPWDPPQKPLELELTWAEDDTHVHAGLTIRSAARETDLSAASRSVVAAADVKELRDFFDGDVPVPAGDVKTFIERSVTQAAEAASTRSDEDLLKQLDKLGTRLTDVSSEDRLSRLSGRFADWLDTTDRATRPAAEPVAGRFDADTAQIHDVLRETGGDIGKHGQTHYFAILIDAAGRTEKVPLGDLEGERLYKTMALIKKHPLLEAVYRDIVMAFLDKLAGDTRPL